MVWKSRRMKESWLEMLAVFRRPRRGRVSTVEKKERFEYRTVHSSYQMTACLAREHWERRSPVAFTTHCWHRAEGTSPLHMNRPYTLSDGDVPSPTVLLENSVVVALEDREVRRVLRLSW